MRLLSMEPQAVQPRPRTSTPESVALAIALDLGLTAEETARIAEMLAPHIAPPPMMTVEKAAERLEVNPETIKRLIHAGKLPALDAGTGKHKEFRIDVADLGRLRFAPSLMNQPHSRPARRPRSPNSRPVLRVG